MIQNSVVQIFRTVARAALILVGGIKACLGIYLNVRCICLLCLVIFVWTQPYFVSFGKNKARKNTNWNVPQKKYVWSQVWSISKYLRYKLLSKYCPLWQEWKLFTYWKFHVLWCDVNNSYSSNCRVRPCTM